MNVVKRKKGKGQFCDTLRNKLYAGVIMSAGVLSVCMSDDATFLVLATAISLPLFFAKENWIY